MSFQKKMLAFAAVSALTAATAVPAMALENEFHGMYKFMGYQTNALNGNNKDGVTLDRDANSGFFAEQRARLLYTAKANDNLKLVTHFEIDARFGGGDRFNTADLDADELSLETKNVYLDFKEPNTETNFKVGIQPWSDAYGSLFLAADMSGVYATKKFDALTASLGWFRFDDDTTEAEATADGPGQQTADLIVADAKFAVNKDVTVGASYYNIQNDAPVALGTSRGFELLHMLGVNADLKVGSASIKPFAAYQFGEIDNADDISAYILGATAKVKAGPGNVNLAAYYLSGDDSQTGDTDSFQTVNADATYFNPANMWLLVRSSNAVNTSTSVLDNDLTAGGLGTTGLFAGYEGTADKVFYNANIGFMMTSEDVPGTSDNVVGTELNAQVGYKLYDNMSVSAAAAYAFLGDVFDNPAGDPDDPYLFNVQVSYLF
uniref:Histidine kinase n=1 Tax=Geobacter sp. (strain M21) TaxID=443144 RepID=C6DZR2_GEOSM